MSWTEPACELSKSCQHDLKSSCFMKCRGLGSLDAFIRSICWFIYKIGTAKWVGLAYIQCNWCVWIQTRGSFPIQRNKSYAFAWEENEKNYIRCPDCTHMTSISFEHFFPLLSRLNPYDYVTLHSLVWRFFFPLFHCVSALFCSFSENAFYCAC